MMITRRAAMSGLVSTTAFGLAMPAVLRGALAQSGATTKFGMVVPITGPAAASGQFAIIGAKIAQEAINKAGGVLGKPLELVTEDDQTTNPGAVLAFSKLASQPDMVAFLGSIRSTQMHAMAPDMLKAAKPVGFGGTDPNLTKLGNPWLFRFRPNDSYSGKVIAQYGAQTLAKKKWAIVHSTDAFGTAGAKALTDALPDNGGTVSLDQGYANQSQDFTPVVLAIKSSGAEVIGSYFTFENDLGIFARQLRQLGVNLPWVGSPSIVNAVAIQLAGATLNGSYGVADYNEDSSPAAKAFATLFREKSKALPDNQSSWTYDAVTVLSMAINKAASTDPQKIRAAMLTIRGHAGAEGTYNFDQYGDGLHGYNIVKNNGGKIAFEKRIDFDAPA